MSFRIALSVHSKYSESKCLLGLHTTKSWLVAIETPMIALNPGEAVRLKATVPGGCKTAALFLETKFADLNGRFVNRLN